jgi:hypothetical protein
MTLSTFTESSLMENAQQEGRRNCLGSSIGQGRVVGVLSTTGPSPHFTSYVFDDVQITTSDGVYKTGLLWRWKAIFHSYPDSNQPRAKQHHLHLFSVNMPSQQKKDKVSS